VGLQVTEAINSTLVTIMVVVIIIIIIIKISGSNTRKEFNRFFTKRKQRYTGRKITASFVDRYK
jgi:hypothetical protein